MPSHPVPQSAKLVADRYHIILNHFHVATHYLFFYILRAGRHLTYGGLRIYICHLAKNHGIYTYGYADHRLFTFHNLYNKAGLRLRNRKRHQYNKKAITNFILKSSIAVNIKSLGRDMAIIDTTNNG